MAKTKKTNKNELAIIKTNEYAIIQSNGLQHMQAIQENLGGEALSVADLPHITVPAGGGLQWEIESFEAPNGVEYLTEIVGVPVLQRVVRVYWASSIDESGGGSPPDCCRDD